MAASSAIASASSAALWLASLISAASLYICAMVSCSRYRMFLASSLDVRDSKLLLPFFLRLGPLKTLRVSNSPAAFCLLYLIRGPRPVGPGPLPKKGLLVCACISCFTSCCWTRGSERGRALSGPCHRPSVVRSVGRTCCPRPAQGCAAVGFSFENGTASNIICTPV